MEEDIIKELEYCGQMLENHFHDMTDIEFTVENGKLYILSARVGKRTALANLRIVISMFCEGKMSVSDVFQKLPYQQVVSFLDTEVISNEHELKQIGQGLSASGGVASATVCYTALEAENFIEQKKEFIFCQVELSPEVIHIVMSIYCRGIITARGGMTSHAAVVCRGIHKPCIVGVGDFNEIRNLANLYNNEVTINANNGSLYAGIGIIKKKKTNLIEIKILHKLLLTVIKYNIVTPEICPLIWRLWDVIVLDKRYGRDNTKQPVAKNENKYISFEQPEKSEIDSILLRLQYIPNSGFIVEDLIGFLFDELSAQVPLGSHYLYTRPLLNPMDAIEYSKKGTDVKYSGVQLTGVEFFQINKFIDFLLDIYSIKIYFITAFYDYDTPEGLKNNYGPLNYLDYTNPHGESLILNNYDAIKIAVYINDVLVLPEELPKVYHLLRRRKYHWTWYQDNKVSKIMIVDYLKANKFREGKKTKLYFLCEEMHLIHDDRLTKTGVSLLEDKKVENNNNIDYILDQVLLRGYNDNSSECNDFSILIQRKDFKDLIALELYEYYFWDERHEFDLQLLKEIVESVATYLSNPDVIKQIEAGILQNIPSALVLSCVAAIWAKLKTMKKKKKNSKEDDSSWLRIQENIKKIDKEFKNHDYVLTEEIETIFGTSREEIQPLLKLCGCKCYVHKNRSIWIKVGIKEERVKEILKMHHFKYKL